MIYDELKAKGLVEEAAQDFHQAIHLMNMAQKDLKTAQALVGTDREWAYTIAAQAILRAASALTVAEGLRPKGREQGRTLLQLAGFLVGEGDRSVVSDLDQIRKKGQRFLEKADRPISLYEVESTLKVAEQFLGVVAKRVYSKDPQRKLL
jgi:hypothetical protein